MEFLIISGMSGAGKSRAMATLEDLGFYCVDNLPPELFVQLAQHCMAAPVKYERVAVVSDVRSGQSTDGLLSAMAGLTAIGCTYHVLFMEASDATIIQRYKETRRKHPLATAEMSLTDTVQRERRLLQPIRERANYIVDTSTTTLARLRSELIRLFGQGRSESAMTVYVTSFGFKHGLPLDADLVFDVRFLPNPYYIAGLKELTGLDPAVRDYVLSYQQTKDYLTKLEDLLAFSLPLYVDEGKTNLVIAVGCTGGHHRSVCLARIIGDFAAKRGYPVVVSHRDMGK